jgi:hypothetical protein
MSKNYERIKASITASSVSAEDKKSMIDVFAEVADENLGDIANLFEKDISWVAKFDENRKMKHKAATTNDSSLWKEILEQEKKYLADLTYGLD